MAVLGGTKWAAAGFADTQSRCDDETGGGNWRGWPSAEDSRLAGSPRDRMYGGNVPPPNSPIQSNLRRVRLQEEVDAIALEKLRFSGVLGLLVMGMAVWAVHTSWSSTTTTRVPALAPATSLPASSCKTRHTRHCAMSVPSRGVRLPFSARCRWLSEPPQGRFSAWSVQDR